MNAKNRLLLLSFLFLFLNAKTQESLKRANLKAFKNINLSQYVSECNDMSNGKRLSNLLTDDQLGKYMVDVNLTCNKSCNALYVNCTNGYFLHIIFLNFYDSGSTIDDLRDAIIKEIHIYKGRKYKLYINGRGAYKRVSHWAE